ncbi:MAG: class I SAM-dependent methyltransferase [Candidatus Marsarchaeota archaeon]|nr:class I SAM-dependent methyltransferase [Candidatus Marsarchaeota archaeon]
MELQKYIRDYALNAYLFDGNAEDEFVGKLIFKYVKGKRVLDLGCGPTEPILSVFYPEAEEVVAVDSLKANIDFGKKNSPQMKKIIGRALAYKNHELSNINKNPKIKYMIGDVTKNLRVGKFDSAMQIGCFGCLGTAKRFQKAVENAYKHLKKDGTLLMMNWEERVPGESPNEPYYTSAPIDCAPLYVPALRNAGFHMTHVHSFRKLKKDSKDVGFTRIIWAVAKK